MITDIQIIHSCLSPQQVERCSYTAMNLASCNESREFWASWNGGLVAAGPGSTIGQNTVMEYDFFSDQGIKYVTITTRNGAHGVWHIASDQGD